MKARAMPLKRMVLADGAFVDLAVVGVRHDGLLVHHRPVGFLQVAQQQGARGVQVTGLEQPQVALDIGLVHRPVAFHLVAGSALVRGQRAFAIRGEGFFAVLLVRVQRSQELILHALRRIGGRRQVQPVQVATLAHSLDLGLARAGDRHQVGAEYRFQALGELGDTAAAEQAHYEGDEGAQNERGDQFGREFCIVQPAHRFRPEEVVGSPQRHEQLSYFYRQVFCELKGNDLNKFYWMALVRGFLADS